LNEDGVAIAAAVGASESAAKSKSTFSWAMPLMGVGCLLALTSFFVARRRNQMRSTREFTMLSDARALAPRDGDQDLEDCLE
jgi:hypothetical protein